MTAPWIHATNLVLGHVQYLSPTDKDVRKMAILGTGYRYVKPLTGRQTDQGAVSGSVYDHHPFAQGVQLLYTYQLQMTDTVEILEPKAALDKLIAEYRQAKAKNSEIEKYMNRDIDEEHPIEKVRKQVHDAQVTMFREVLHEFTMLNAIYELENAKWFYISKKENKNTRGHCPRSRQGAIYNAALSEKEFAVARNAYARAKRQYEVKKATQLILRLKQPKEGNTHVQFPQRDRKVPIIVRLVCIDINDEKQGIITLDDCPIARTFQFTKQIRRDRSGVRGKEEGSVYESLCTRLAGKLALALYDAWVPYEIDDIHQSLKKHCNPNAEIEQDTPKFIIGLRRRTLGEYKLLIYSTRAKVHQMQPQAKAHWRIESTDEIPGENKFNMWLYDDILNPLFDKKYTLTKTTNVPHGEESIWRSYTAKALSAVGM